MKHHTWRVSADVPGHVRDAILRAHTPRFEQLHLSAVTWAYGVEAGFPFDPEVQDCVLTGIHRGPGHEAFTLVLGGTDRRPDGRRLFLAFSTEAGVRPAEAGEINPGSLVPIEPIPFAAQLRLRPNFQRTPTRNLAYSEVRI